MKEAKANLDDIAASIVGCFPKLDLLEQRLSLELYRLLTEGQAVPRASLAERLIPCETVTESSTVGRVYFPTRSGR
jgi:hypothetical protein